MTGHWSVQVWQGWGGASESVLEKEEEVEVQQEHLSDQFCPSLKSVVLPCRVLLTFFTWAIYETPSLACLPIALLSYSAFFSEALSPLGIDFCCLLVNPGSMFRNNMRSEDLPSAPKQTLTFGGFIPVC